MNDFMKTALNVIIIVAIKVPLAILAMPFCFLCVLALCAVADGMEKQSCYTKQCTLKPDAVVEMFLKPWAWALKPCF